MSNPVKRVQAGFLGCLAWLLWMAGPCLSDEPLTVAASEQPGVSSLFTSEWVTCTDKAISVRVSADLVEIKRTKPLIFVAEIRNNTKQSLYVLRPFGDEYRTLSTSAIELRGPSGIVKFTGAHRTYPLGQEAFTTLKPGESVRDRVDLTVDHFADSEAPGVYTIVFTYTVTKHDVPLDKKGEFDPPWVGTVQAPPIKLTKR